MNLSPNQPLQHTSYLNVSKLTPITFFLSVTSPEDNFVTISLYIACIKN